MPTQVTSEIVERLYRLAPRLRANWKNVPLREDFDTSMVLAVVRTLDKVGYKRGDGTRRSADEQIVFAEKLFQKYWNDNASRDEGRYSGRIEQGTPRVVSIDLVAEQPGDRTVYCSISNDIFSGKTGRDVAHFLAGRGLATEQAWAMVWWLSGRPWDDIAYLLEDRFEVVLPTNVVRQWQKKFARILPEVSHFFAVGADETEMCGKQRNRAAEPGLPGIEYVNVKARRNRRPSGNQASKLSDKEHHDEKY